MSIEQKHYFPQKKYCYITDEIFPSFFSALFGSIPSIDSSIFWCPHIVDSQVTDEAVIMGSQCSSRAPLDESTLNPGNGSISAKRLVIQMELGEHSNRRNKSWYIERSFWPRLSLLSDLVDCSYLESVPSV